MTSLWELQKALYQRLSTDVSVMGLANGVYDAVEEGLAYPYITIGPPTTLNIETRNTLSEEVSVVIHSWSDYAGKKESYDILNAISAAIGKGLSIEGPFVLLRVERPTFQVIDDLNPRLKHGMARFKFVIKNN